MGKFDNIINELRAKQSAIVMKHAKAYALNPDPKIFLSARKDIGWEATLVLTSNSGISDEDKAVLIPDVFNASVDATLEFKRQTGA